MRLPRTVRQRLSILNIAADTHPFEFYLALFAAAAAIPLVIIGHAPESLMNLIPAWLVRVWGVELALGAVATLWGLLSTTRPYLEEFGLFLLSAAAAVYAIALFVLAGTSGLTAASFMTAVAFACWRRRRNVRRTIVEIDDEVWREIEPPQGGR